MKTKSEALSILLKFSYISLPEAILNNSRNNSLQCLLHNIVGPWVNTYHFFFLDKVNTIICSKEEVNIFEYYHRMVLESKREHQRPGGARDAEHTTGHIKLFVIQLTYSKETAIQTTYCYYIWMSLTPDWYNFTTSNKVFFFYQYYFQVPTKSSKKVWLLTYSSSEQGKEREKKHSRTFLNMLNWKYTWCVQLTHEHMPVALAAWVKISQS